jgi:C_GCAxxG_C_C family probable redox protein
VYVDSRERDIADWMATTEFGRRTRNTMDEKIREKLLQTAYDKGYEYENTYRGCGQVVIAALQETFDMLNPDVFKSLTGWAGGGSTVGDSGCGAYVAGVMFLSGLKGREYDNFADPERIRFESFAIARKLHEKYIKEFGCVNCHDIHRVIYGRPYYLPDPDEMRKFDEVGGHTTMCTMVCGKGARFAAEIAIDEGLIPEEKLVAAAAKIK